MKEIVSMRKKWEHLLKDKADWNIKLKQELEINTNMVEQFQNSKKKVCVSKEKKLAKLSW